MNIDKISEERLFQNNTKEEVSKWVRTLQYFHYMRDRGGHNCEGDSFCAYFKYNSKDDLIKKLSAIGITANKLTEECIPFDPFKSYSFDDLDKLKITIPHFSDLEQPQHVEIFKYKAHIWVMNECFEIAVSGTKDGKAYRVSEEDFEVCVALEKYFDELNWKSFLDSNIEDQIHCISRKKYPELFA